MFAKAVLEHPQGQVRVCENRLAGGCGSDVGGGDGKTHGNRRYVQHNICTYLRGVC